LARQIQPPSDRHPPPINNWPTLCVQLCPAYLSSYTVTQAPYF